MRIAILTTIVAVSVATASPAVAQRQADIDAIHRLLERYTATEDSMDMRAQAQLMVSDRVWISNGAGRRTDNGSNMRIQQASSTR